MDQRPDERASSRLRKQNQKYEDCVVSLPPSLRFPHSERRRTGNAPADPLRNVNSDPAQFKKSSVVPPLLKLSRLSAITLQSCENTGSNIESAAHNELNRKYNAQSAAQDVDSSSIVQPSCQLVNKSFNSNARKSPDLNSTSIVPGTWTLNNSSRSRSNLVKSPQLYFSYNTMQQCTPGQKCAINIINEVTGLLTPPSAKFTDENISPDLNFKQKDYTKTDLFTNSIALSLSQCSELSQPKSGKHILTDLGESPDFSCRKHIKPTAADVCLTDASKSNDSVSDLLNISLRGNEEALANSPNLSQVSCIQSSQYIADQISATPPSQSHVLFANSFAKTSSTPRTYKLLTDLSYRESPSFSSKKRLFQEDPTFTSLTKKSKRSAVCPREGISMEECFDFEKFNSMLELEYNEYYSPPQKLFFDNLLCFGSSANSLLNLNLADEQNKLDALNPKKITPTKNTDSMFSVIQKTVMENALSEYYNQTVSSQYMINMDKNDFFDESLWKDDESQSLEEDCVRLDLNSEDKDVALNNKYIDINSKNIDVKSKDGSLPKISDKSTDGSLPKISDKTTDGSLPKISDKSTDGSLPKISDKSSDRSLPKMSDKNTDGSLPKISDKSSDGSLPKISDKSTNGSLPKISDESTEFLMETKKSSDESSKHKSVVCNCPDILSVCPHMFNESTSSNRCTSLLEAKDIIFSDEEELGEMEQAVCITSEETTNSSTPPFVKDILNKKLSDSSREEELKMVNTQAIKSLPEYIARMQKSMQESKLAESNSKTGGSKFEPKETAAAESKSNNFREAAVNEPVGEESVSDLITVIGLVAGNHDQKFLEDLDVYCGDLEIIQNSPNEKVDLWLKTHLESEPKGKPIYLEPNIEDSDSEEKAEMITTSIEEVIDIDKENFDSLNIEMIPATQEALEKELVIEDFNTERTNEDVHTQQITDLNTTKEENEVELRMIEEINTERCDEETLLQYHEPRIIEEINTEKCDEQTLLQHQLRIECSDSPVEDDEAEEAARILMSFSHSELEPQDKSVVKTIKFKPGSLGERLRLELNKQKSAMEIWKYEVHKAKESQDKESLVDLYKGRLDLSIVSCRSEYGHVVVRAISTNVAPDERDNDNTVMLLLQVSDFPKRFKQCNGQTLSIFPPWNSHWVPELRMSFLTNISRIQFNDIGHHDLRTQTQQTNVQIDRSDEDFYMKLMGLVGGLVNNKD